MQQGHNGGGAGLETADLAEAIGYIQQDQHAGSDQRYNALEHEFLADGGIDIADLVLNKGVIGVLLVQGSQQAVQLLGGQGIAAGQGDRQGLVARNIRAGLQGQAALVQLGADGGLQVVQIGIALIRQRDHRAALELDIHLDAEHTAENQHKGEQRTGEGIELLAVADEVDGRGLKVGTAVLTAAEQPCLAQRLEIDGTADHNAGRPDAEHEVEQNAGQQGEAEGVDRTGSGGSEPEENRVEHLGPEAVRGAEGTHQDRSNDHDGHIAVNDGRQAHLEAALDSAVKGLVLGQLLLDALGRDDIGVNAHTDAEDDTGNAGQRQRGAGENGEITGDNRQRSRNLTQQGDDGDGAGQTIAADHHDRNEDKGNDTGLHHDIQTLGAQRRADGGVALSRQSKRQRAGIDLVGQRGGAILIKIALDDGLTAGDGLIDGGGGDIVVIQPDRDGAFVGSQLGGGGGKGGGTVGIELQLYDPALSLIVGGVGGSHIVTAQDLLTRGGRALAEYHLGRGADLVNSGLRVKVRLVALPRETHDDTILVVVNIALVIGDAEADKAILDDRFGCCHLLIGGIHITGRHECDIHAAADVNTEADIRCALDIDILGIAIGIAYTEDGRQGKQHDQNCHDEQRP